MRIQHLLLSSDGENQIIETEAIESELVIPAPLSTATGSEADSSAGRRVAVKKHYCKGRYYAVALERHAASNEIDDIIDFMQPAPLDDQALKNH
ncbi:hypothetical protein O3W44_03555 [Pantoea sp. LMR881]|uniref:hypothetical protein n=1 Tax=Pantoea sp. LMR881 TaxID=3014336 RepID=UPI0022AE9F21|nr:hypothetical protein [Pantoea sp. LMR881]MCZ4058362.1 hypothetical protein [Pantoea sp. LMR881]